MGPEGPPGALDGLTVIDLTRLLPGPCCSMILADHGARVIRVEPVGHAETPVTAIPLPTLMRGKMSICLDLKSEAGREVFYRLVAHSDVLLEGYRRGVPERLGVDEATLRGHNPALVYCSLTGYGAEGPRRDQVGHDLNFLAATGLLELTSPGGAPPCVPGLQVADVAGALHAAFGVLAALRHRDRTGEGQRVDVALADAALSLTPAVLSFLDAGVPHAMGASPISGGLACYGIYRTRDGRHLALGALEPRYFRNFLEVLGLSAHLRHQFLPARQADLRRVITTALEAEDLAHWVEVFAGVDACLTPVESYADALEDPAWRARGQVQEIGDGRRVLGPTVHLDASPAAIRTPPPAPGQHTVQILTELGYPPDAVQRLKDLGVAE